MEHHSEETGAASSSGAGERDRVTPSYRCVAYVTRRLTHANLHNDMQALDECARLMQPLREAWASIAPARDGAR